MPAIYSSWWLGRRDERSVLAMAPMRAYLSEIFSSLQGEGEFVGRRHLFVRFAGCNIRCSYCDTPDSLVRVPSCRVDYPSGENETVDNPIDIARLNRVIERMIEEDPAIDMIAITGGEPMVQHGFLARWLNADPPARPCLLETNATISRDLAQVLMGIDTVSADIKLESNSGESGLAPLHEEFLRRAATAKTRLYVKLPIDDRTVAAEIDAAVALVVDCVPNARIYVQPISDPTSDAWCGSPATLVAAAGQIRRRHADVGVLPQMHKLAGLR